MVNYFEEERPVHFKKKKNTKKWCKGKEGREHVPEMIYRSRYGLVLKPCGPKARFVRWDGQERRYEKRWLCFHELICSNCKKILEHFPNNCPDNDKNIKDYWTK